MPHPYHHKRHETRIIWGLTVFIILNVGEPGGRPGKAGLPRGTGDSPNRPYKYGRIN